VDTVDWGTEWLTSLLWILGVFVATVIVLVLISRTRGNAGSVGPASLGMVFVPDR